jgi:surface protein
MFSDSEFNGDINQWNVSNVNEMQWMFNDSKFNKNISNWNVSNVINMKGMFEDTQFNKNIKYWNINPSCNIINIFNKCPIKKEYKPSINNIIKSRLNYNNINKNIADIDDILINIISKIILLEKVRIEEYKILTSFISIYKVENSDEIVNIRKHLCGLFGNSVNLNWIDVSSVTDMCWVFSRADFNGDISKWDVSNVKNMSWMFKESTFNGDISNWDVSNVTNMTEMFYESNFNRDISGWDVSNVTNAYNIFRKSIILDKYKPIFIKK